MEKEDLPEGEGEGVIPAPSSPVPVVEAFKLLPCPFCGSADVEAASPTVSWFLIRCRGCGLETDSFEADINDEVLAAKWNRRVLAIPTPGRTAEPDTMVEVERLTRERDEARADAERAEAERDELRDAPWPKWVTDCLTIIRKHSGYDGYDDATEGVDLPSELEETLDEAVTRAETTEAQLATLRAEVELLRGLSEKATGGKDLTGPSAHWQAFGRYIGTRNHLSYIGEVRDENGNWSDTAKSKGDAAFISAAVNFVRTLLSTSGADR